MDEMDADPSLSRTPAVGTYLHRMTADDGVALARSELVPDRKWERSWDYHNLHLAIGIDHTIWCFRSIPGTAHEVNGVIMCRPVGRRDYSPRQKAIVREVHAETGPLVGGPLARFTDPAPSELPPRVRQVLRCLLEGDADKQVAARLGLTRHTVNEYVKVIHAHFGVCSRGELLARWVRLFMPMLRGENGNPGTYESFLGEVDDAIAAGRFVTSLPNVDGANVFVAGHSVGGVLTCLVSMLPSPYKAAAALDGYVDMESWAGVARRPRPLRPHLARGGPGPQPDGVRGQHPLPAPIVRWRGWAGSQLPTGGQGAAGGQGLRAGRGSGRPPRDGRASGAAVDRVVPAARRQVRHAEPSAADVT
jgi:DNA-binding CsgD family transcriptional regulator